MTMADQTHLLRELDAERAIRALMGNYLAARDDRRPGPEVAALFAPDGVWEGLGHQGAQLGRHHGRAAIARRFSRPLPPTLHLLTEEDIQVTGDRARGRWRYLAPAVLEGEPSWMAGRYEIDFVVHDGRWRFAHVRVRPLLAAAHRHGWATLDELDEHDLEADG
jgi:uncharacterized protein (TIGR02246 family)